MRADGRVGEALLGSQENLLVLFANARGGLDKRLADLLAHVES
jgi:hypothetical protein